jgi:hypothetical protein
MSTCLWRQAITRSIEAITLTRTKIDAHKPSQMELANAFPAPQPPNSSTSPRSRHIAWPLRAPGSTPPPPATSLAPHATDAHAPVVASTASMSANTVSASTALPPAWPCRATPPCTSSTAPVDTAAWRQRDGGGGAKEPLPPAGADRTIRHHPSATDSARTSEWAPAASHPNARRTSPPCLRPQSKSDARARRPLDSIHLHRARRVRSGWWRRAARAHRGRGTVPQTQREDFSGRRAARAPKHKQLARTTAGATGGKSKDAPSPCGGPEVHARPHV